MLRVLHEQQFLFVTSYAQLVRYNKLFAPRRECLIYSIAQERRLRHSSPA